MSARVVLLGSLAVAAIGGALNGCGRPLIPGTAGTPGTGGSTAPGAMAGTGGASGSGGGADVPACPPLVRGNACTPADPQVCYKTCGPERTGTKSVTCQRDGTYLDSPICSYDPSKDYSCYAIPSTANAVCPPGVVPQGSMACDVDHCVLCNSAGGLAGGQYFDSGGAPKTGYCTCQLPNADGLRTWTCASEAAWPCPLGIGCNRPAGRGGSGGSGASTGGIGGSAAGAGGTTGGGGMGGSPHTPGFGEPVCPSTVVKGGACTSADAQFCYKPCGPENVGAKTETCTTAGTYAEMSGCSFDPVRDYSCYTIPTTANVACPAGVVPQHATTCDVPQCTLCNSLQGWVGGSYIDAAGGPKIGWCVCKPPGANGLRTWSCASDTSWPCPLGIGCDGSTGRGGSGGSGDGAGGRGGAGGASGTGGIPGWAEPTCASSVVKGGACGPADQQFCYKPCGPENLGVKTETCTTAGTYAEMSGCSFDPRLDYSCYKIPAQANAACPVAVTPQHASTCDVPVCTLCNSLRGTVVGRFLDASGAPKVGWCICQPPDSNGLRAWNCASDTSWPCPLGAGC